MIVQKESTSDMGAYESNKSISSVILEPLTQSLHLNS